MTHKVYVVTDLGPGDGGKGSVVHKICDMMRPHTVIKRGGAQGSHGVTTSKGEKFAFSQWGCGTLNGIPTHISDQMVVSPEGLLNEADHLRYRHGIHDAFSLLSVDERALCATPFHAIASRLKELARGDKPRGTVGTGMGHAYRSYLAKPEYAVMVSDLRKADLRDRLAAVRHLVQSELQSVISGEFLDADRAEVDMEVAFLYDEGFLEYVFKRFATAAKQVRIVGSDYLSDAILAQDGVAVVETSHGVLTDRLAGFHPHTSAIRTLPIFTERMLRNSGYEGQIVNLAVTRAYAVRHGAGPMPTANPVMIDRLLDGSAKDANRYQGKIRVGALDFVLLKYAIEACGGPEAFDGLAVTWFDQILSDGIWEVCSKYAGANDHTFFSPSGEIKVDQSTGLHHLQHQEALGQKLLESSPEITTMEVNKQANDSETYELCSDLVKEHLGIPLRMLSVGPTELNKLCK